MKDPNRVYRAAFLRADEAAKLTRDAKNERFSCGCPHLGIFHNTGNKSDGGTWRACQFLGCGCVEDFPADALTRLVREQDEYYERRARRNLKEAFFLIGLVVGAGATVVMSAVL